MADLITRAQQILASFADTSVEPWQQAVRWLQILSDVVDFDLSQEPRGRFETAMIAIHDCLSRYKISVYTIIVECRSFDEFQRISAADLDEIQQHAGNAAAAIIDSESRRVMATLASDSRDFPEYEIESVQRHPDLFVPLLLADVKRFAVEAHAGQVPVDGTCFFGTFLLLELQIAEAYPHLIEMLLCGREDGQPFFDETSHEMLPPILALCYKNCTDKIDEILRDTNINKFLRWSVAKAYIHLLRDGDMQRDAVIHKFRKLIVECVDRVDYEMITPYVCFLADLAAVEEWELIQSMFDKNLVDESVIGIRTATQIIEGGEESIQQCLENCRPTGMPDAIAELRRWAAFATGRAHERFDYGPVWRIPEPNLLSRPDAEFEPAPTVRRSGPIVGRNDPCPCGSGKKFKKCCKTVPID